MIKHLFTRLHTSHRLQCLGAALLTGLVLSCSSWNPLGLAQGQVQIEQIRQTPEPRTVQIQGTVTKLAPFLQGGAYQLQDATGSIWVKTDRPLPKSGENLVVTGQVNRQVVTVDQTQWDEVYLQEVTYSGATAPQPSPLPSPSPQPINSPSIAPVPSPVPAVSSTSPSPPPSASIPAPPQPSKSPATPTLNLHEQFLPHKRLK
ncbi:hypothetical protein [Synechocystis sp. LKSZ1]|uniref:hypothetical protein n=1 Tax=Synechocystis sp. LKSZ1 TaxID=3144951 RepID=UPI00336BF59B